MRRLNYSGDTIVEVLLAILVISTILGGAFVSARRSQTGIRATEERLEALKVAEAQVERIRLNAKTSRTVFSSPGVTAFCITSTNAKLSATLRMPLINDNFAQATWHPAGCNSTPAGGVTYYTVVQKAADPDHTFTVYTRWDGAGGTGKQEVQLSIRIDP